MNWTSEHLTLARQIVKRMGLRASPSALHFFIKRHFSIDPTLEDVNQLLEMISSPIAPTSSKPLSLHRTQHRAREICLQIINELKAEVDVVGFKSHSSEITEEGITPVLCLSDLHFGEIIEVNGFNIFDMSIAENAFMSIIDQAIATRELMPYTVDEFVVLLAGDIIDGELIYPAQAFETDGNAYSQMKAATAIIWKGLVRLSEAFGTIRVYCVPGNHGRSSKLHAQMSNWDNVLYWGLQLIASMQSDYPIEVNTPHQMWMDFKVRHWNVHTRHIGVVQAATASSAKKVMTWMDQHNADLFFYGHYHNPEMYSLGYKRIFKNGSLPPANEFAERLGFQDSRGQWLIGVTNQNPVSFSKILIPEGFDNV